MAAFNFFGGRREKAPVIVSIERALELCKDNEFVEKVAGEYLGFMYHSQKNGYAHDDIANSAQESALISALATKGIVLEDTSARALSMFARQLTFSTDEESTVAA